MNEAMYARARVVAVDDDVRRAGLAGHVVAGDRGAGGGPAVGEHAAAASSAARAAAVGEMIRWPAGVVRRLAADRLDDVRRAEDPAVGDRRVRGRHLHRRDRLALARTAGCPSTSPSTATSAGRSPAPRPAGRRRSASRTRTGEPSSRTAARRASSRSRRRRCCSRRGGCWRPTASRRRGPRRRGSGGRRPGAAEGLSNTVFGVTSPSCSAPATVIALNVDPGS